MNEHGETPGEHGGVGRPARRDAEHDIRAAFEHLRDDAREVDTMAALRELEGKRRWLVPAAIGCAVAALLLVLGLVVLGGDDDPDENVATIDDDDPADTDAATEDEDEGAVSVAARLESPSWVLVEGTGPDGPIPILEDWPLTIAFADGTVSGSAACNSYGGDVTIDDDGGVTIADVGSTLRACEPAPIMATEAAFQQALSVITPADLADDGSVLLLTGAAVELRFEPASAAEPGPGQSVVVDAAPVVVEGEGLGVVDPESGSLRRLPLGSPAGQVLEALDGLLGERRVPQPGGPDGPLGRGRAAGRAA